MAGQIFTIGHGGQTAEELLEHLQRHDVQYVVDVRSSPYSRFQPHFSQDPLSALLTRHGLRYVFMGAELGGRPDDPDCYIDGRVDYDTVRTKAFFRRGIDRLHSAQAQRFRVCLLCSEGKPWQCHRAKLIGVTLLDDGIDVLHILPTGETCPQDEAIRELTGGQESLFGDSFVSRKAYK
jgi:uncharacterized protein (DUF488 family)